MNSESLANKDIVALARRSIEYYIHNREIMPISSDIDRTLLTHRAGVFVCLKKNGKLRGCIGTFEPRCSSVAEEIVKSAVQASFCDPRFSPLREEELNEVRLSVDILTYPEKVSGFEELDPSRYGVIVEWEEKKGLLLPDIEGVDTVEYQVDIARQKAGIPPHAPFILYRFSVERFTEPEKGKGFGHG